MVRSDSYNPEPQLPNSTAEMRDRKIQALEEEVEELKLKVCWCAKVEEEIDAPEEVKVR